MMKKVGLLLCAALIAVLFAACAKQNAASASGEEISAASENAAGTVSAEGSVAVAAEPVPEEEMTAATAVSASKASGETTAVTEPAPEKEPVAPVHLYKNACSKAIQDAEGTPEARVSWENPVLYREDAEKYPALAEAIAAENAAQTERMEHLLPGLAESYVEIHAMNNYLQQLESEETVTVLRADSRVVSVEYYDYEWMGGAHPNWGFSAANFDPQTGEKIKLTDVVTDPVAFFLYVQEKIDILYAEVRPTLISVLDYAEGADFSDFSQFAVTNEGVQVYFSPYSLGPYASGAQIVEVPFEEHPELFIEKYTKTTDSYVIPIVYDRPVLVDVNGDGTRELIAIDRETADDYYEKWHVRSGEKELFISDGCYSEDSFIVKSEGKYYLYIFGLSDNDWRILRVVDLCDMTFKEGEYMSPFVEPEPSEDLIHFWRKTEAGNEFCNSKACFTDPSDFCMRARMDLFSTVSGYKNYYAGTDGAPVSDEPLYRIFEYPVLKTKVELLCDVVDESGRTVEKATIPAGTYLRAVSSDGKNFADMQTVDPSLVSADDSYGIVRYDMEGAFLPDPGAKTYRVWQRHGEEGRTVNDTGLPENEVFDGMQYAG